MRLIPDATSFGDLLRRTLVLEKRLPLAQVAAALGMTERGFRSKMLGGGRFDPDEVATLLRVIDDARLLGWFFSGSALLPVKPPAGLPQRNQALLPCTMACATEALAAIEALADALDLSVKGERRKTALLEHLDRAQHGLWSVDFYLAPPFVDPDVAANEDFPRLVHRLLRVDQGISPYALANALYLKYPALHERMAGRVAFLPSEIKALLRAFPDPRLADYLLAGTGYRAIRRPAAVEGHAGESPTRLGLQSLREMTRFLGLMLTAGEGPDAAMRATATRHLRNAVQLVATMHWQMTHIGQLAA